MSKATSHERPVDRPESAQSVVQRALDGWMRGINDGHPTEVATYFTEDALFQGSHPDYSLGSNAVAQYYAEPHAEGLTVSYVVREVRNRAEGVVLAFVDPTFVRPDGMELPYHLTVIVRRDVDAEWRISHYHVSKIS